MIANHKTKPKAHAKVQQEKWYQQGYSYGFEFAREEAEYEELAAIARAKEIPVHWDIFRGEIINRYLDDPLFDFQAYSEGFSKACMEFFKKI